MTSRYQQGFAHLHAPAAFGFASLVWVSLIASASAQEYPTQPIKLVVPFAAGSGQDLRARQIGNLLTPRLGQPIVIDNRPGAEGAIGTAVAAKAKADGYTLLYCNSSTLAGNAALMPKLPYDPIRDFVPIVRLVISSGVVAVSASSEVHSLQQLLALARRKPGALRYGSGSAYSHMLGELVSRRAGVEWVYVPYKGESQALTDLLGGHIDLMFSFPILLLPQAQAGRVRILAVAGPHRMPALPAVPTVAEQGLNNSELRAWAGICAPTGTPSTVVIKINREVLAAMMTPAVKAEVESQGYEVTANTSQEFLAFIKTDISHTASLVKDLAIPPEQ
jgi:tripartite-type tricarboxylate transporter receptor subunit TctC